MESQPKINHENHALNHQLQLKVNRWLTAMQAGQNLNDALTRNKAFRNPYATVKLLSTMGIQEYKSFLPPIEPDFPLEGTFYDELKRKQTDLIDHRDKQAMDRAQGKLEPRTSITFTNDSRTWSLEKDDGNAKGPQQTQPPQRRRYRSRSPPSRHRQPPGA